MRGRSVKLPFVIAGVHGGLAKAEGIADIRETGMVLEFEVVDWRVSPSPRTKAEEARLVAPEIRSAELKVGWFRTRLVIEATSLSVMSDIPGSKRGRVTLRIPRKEREAARKAEALLAAGLAREELEGLREELGRGRDESGHGA